MTIRQTEYMTVIFLVALGFALFSLVGCAPQEQVYPTQTGAVGATGATGATGPQGQAGTDGSSCTVSQTDTGALISCTDGSSATIDNGVQGPVGPMGPQGIQGIAGQIGASGAQGDTGPQGPEGEQGPAGQDATSVTTVQFCASYGPTVYPSAFPEQGICIDGNIYAVYWDGKNAWLAEIVPGEYMSTATGLSCDFMVSEGCQVN